MNETFLRRLFRPARPGVIVFGLAFVAIIVTSLAWPPQRATLSTGPSPGITGPRLKVESCNTIAEEAGTSALVVAEGRTFFVGQAFRLYCYRTVTVQEMRLGDRSYLCTQDERHNGECAPIIDSH